MDKEKAVNILSKLKLRHLMVKAPDYCTERKYAQEHRDILEALQYAIDVLQGDKE